MNLSTALPSPDVTALHPPVTICILCYGNYPDLARRLLESLIQHTRFQAYRLRLGLNAISDATSAVVDRLLPHLPVETVIRSETNLYKLPMMRRLFYDSPLETDWTIWFDDDSYVWRSDWLAMLHCQSRLHPEVAMWGQKLFVRGDDELRAFVSQSTWFTGVELLPDEDPKKCRLEFIAGGFWAVRTTCIHALHWPDPRLIHFGDDYLLGEALRQRGLAIGSASSGVAINQCPRRAPAETPRCSALR
jgi:hypothetical protein